MTELSDDIKDLAKRIGEPLAEDIGTAVERPILMTCRLSRKLVVTINQIPNDKIFSTIRAAADNTPASTDSMHASLLRITIADARSIIHYLAFYAADNMVKIMANTNPPVEVISDMQVTEEALTKSIYISKAIRKAINREMRAGFSARMKPTETDETLKEIIFAVNEVLRHTNDDFVYTAFKTDNEFNNQTFTFYDEIANAVASKVKETSEKCVDYLRDESV